MALELASRGFSLLLTYRSRRDGCEETAALAREAGRAAGFAVEARTDFLDLADRRCVESYAGSVREALGEAPLDTLVHNASSYEETPFRSLSFDALEAMHRIEVVSPLMLTTLLRDPLARSPIEGGGAVVLFGDMFALGRARPGFTGYMLAKASVEMLARQLAVELAPAVRVHCIAPGVILWPDGFPDDAKAAILARTPLGRAGTPEDAARLVRFLVLEAPFMTGGTIALDGGRALR